MSEPRNGDVNWGKQTIGQRLLSKESCVSGNVTYCGSGTFLFFYDSYHNQSMASKSVIGHLPKCFTGLLSCHDDRDPSIVIF